MITLKEAFLKASEAKGCSKIIEIYDAGNFWWFIDELLDICLGRRSIAVNKEDGKLWYVWPPDLTAEQNDALDHAKRVPISKI